MGAQGGRRPAGATGSLSVARTASLLLAPGTMQKICRLCSRRGTVSVIACVGTVSSRGKQPSSTCCSRQVRSSSTTFTDSGSARSATGGSLNARCPLTPIPQQTMSTGSGPRAAAYASAAASGSSPGSMSHTEPRSTWSNRCARSHSPKSSSDPGARPTYSSMWKASTRPQSRSSAAASLARVSVWLGAAANTIRTRSRTASCARTASAMSTPARRPSSERSPRMFTCNVFCSPTAFPIPCHCCPNRCVNCRRKAIERIVPS